MPGTDLNLDLPTLADTMADVVAKLVIAVETIETDLEPRITAGELDINTELSLGGAPLTNAGGVRLTGGATDVEGSIFEEDGDFFMVTGAGVVRITQDGGINVASAGIIGGDYGSGNPAALNYDDGAGAFDFSEDPSVWADVRVNDVVLNNQTTSGKVTLHVDDAITTARSINVKTLPASGVSALVYVAATSTLETADTARVTADLKVTNVDATGTTALAATSTAALTVAGNASVSGNMTVAGSVNHGVYEIVLPLDSASLEGSASFLTKTWSNVTAAYAFNTELLFRVWVPVRVGERVTEVRLTYQNDNNGTGSEYPSIRLYSLAPGGVITQIGSQEAFGTAGLNGSGTITLTISAPVTVAAGTQFFVWARRKANGPGTTFSVLRAFYDAP